VSYEGVPLCMNDYYKLAGLMCGICGDVINGGKGKKEDLLYGFSY